MIKHRNFRDLPLALRQNEQDTKYSEKICKECSEDKVRFYTAGFTEMIKKLAWFYKIAQHDSKIKSFFGTTSSTHK